MINGVGTVSIFVRDQQRAKQFYTEKLGMELRNDTPMYPGASVRWISVAPKGAATELVLFEPDEQSAHYAGTVGKSQAITLDVSDIHALVDDLKAKGVEFITEPDTQFWGTYATLRDSEGNGIMLVELPKGG